jgi:hypothetical protein
LTRPLELGHSFLSCYQTIKVRYVGTDSELDFCCGAGDEDRRAEGRDFAAVKLPSDMGIDPS